MTSCITGRFEIGSMPSIYARSSAAVLPMTGWGTKATRVPGMPLKRATERTTFSKTWVCSATVGTWY